MFTTSEYTSLRADTQLRSSVLACLIAIRMKLDDDTGDTGLAGFRSRPTCTHTHSQDLTFVRVLTPVVTEPHNWVDTAVTCSLA